MPVRFVTSKKKFGSKTPRNIGQWINKICKNQQKVKQNEVNECRQKVTWQMAQVCSGTR